MLYFDTSFLVPLLFAESTSARIQSFIGRQSAGSLAISEWTWLEFSSVLAREVRMEHLDADSAQAANTRFGLLVAASFTVITPIAADFELARQYLHRYETGLRIGDAFHLAIAKNHGVSAIHSLDKGLLKAGVMLGLPVSSAIG
jgi:predicted nucleic acid-binding protein